MCLTPKAWIDDLTARVWWGHLTGSLVIGWRDYVDVGVLAEQKAGKGISDQVKALIDRPALF